MRYFRRDGHALAAKQPKIVASLAGLLVALFCMGALPAPASAGIEE